MKPTAKDVYQAHEDYRRTHQGGTYPKPTEEPEEPTKQDVATAKRLLNLWRRKQDSCNTPVYNGIAINNKTFEVKPYTFSVAFQPTHFDTWNFGPDRKALVETYLDKTLCAFSIANMKRRQLEEACPTCGGDETVLMGQGDDLYDAPCPDCTFPPDPYDICMN